jgi:hypothetical protein
VAVHGFSFTLAAALFGANQFGRSKTCRTMQPATEGFGRPHRPGLLRQIDENRLRQVLRLMRVSDQPQRGGVNQPGVARHQLREGFLGVMVGVHLQQSPVIHGGL